MTTPTASNSETQESVKLLHWKLVGDFSAAIIAASAVSPIVTIMDRATSERATRNRPIVEGVQRHFRCAMSSPRHFLFSPPVGAMSALYAGTYAVSNSSDTIGKCLGLGTVSHDLIRSSVTVAVNVWLGIRKDVLLTRLAIQQPGRRSDGGTLSATDSHPDSSNTTRQQHWRDKPPLASEGRGVHTARASPIPMYPTPRSVLGVFLIRDAITIFCSFTIVDWVSDYMSSNTGHCSELVAQLTIPALSQLFATPVHLLALDMYSRPGSMNIATRMRRQSSNLVPITLFRAIRVIPALGMGLYLNKQLRRIFTA